jgi:hypothetical protein
MQTEACDPTADCIRLNRDLTLVALFSNKSFLFG